jgi:DNA-binding LacI/PurR family transcriptional regulator
MKNENRPITLEDIAREAGVSTGTVSRALSGGTLVNKVTRERIQALAAARNYRPNLLARNLRTRKTGAVAVVIPLGHETEQHLSDPFFTVMLGYLADALSARGNDLLLSRVIPTGPDWIGNYIDSGRVDGVIVIGQSNQSDALNVAGERYAPLVVWGARRDSQKYCTVGSDNRVGGLIAAVHLFERGCKTIAFFGDPSAPEIEQRLEGCRAGCTAAGMKGKVHVLPTHLTADSAYATISAYLDANTPPDGIVAATDVIAMAALRALSERGIKVPEQVKVTGYDDLGFASHTSPPLTTVRQDLELSAHHLVDSLFKRIAGEDTASIVLSPRLVVRESTGGV